MGPSSNLMLSLNYLSCPFLSICLSKINLGIIFFLLSVCPISHKESNVEPPVCPAPNKKPVICPISLVVSPETVNALHVYPVNPVNDNITTLDRINMELSTLTVIAQKPAFAPLSQPVLSPETIYASHDFHVNSVFAIETVHELAICSFPPSVSVEPSALSVPVNEPDYELAVCPVSVSNPVYELSFCPVSVTKPIDDFFVFPATVPGTMNALPVLSVSFLPGSQSLPWFPDQSASHVGFLPCLLRSSGLPLP